MSKRLQNNDSYVTHRDAVIFACTHQTPPPSKRFQSLKAFPKQMKQVTVMVQTLPLPLPNFPQNISKANEANDTYATMQVTVMLQSSTHESR